MVKKHIVFIATAIAIVSLSSCKTTKIVQDFSNSSVSWFKENPREDYDVYSVNCIGNKKLNEVYYTFSLKNNTANKNLELWLCEAYDEFGHMYTPNKDELIFAQSNSSVSGSVDFPTNKYVDFTLIIKNVLPTADKITNLRMKFIVTKPGQHLSFFKSYLIIKDIPIYWK